MKVVAFVPIKMNNERLPGKNIRLFSNGKPLINYILDTLESIEKIDEVYVYCSDEKIQEYLEGYKRIKYLRRDKYLDLSTTSFNEVLTSFSEKISADVYILTHATAPFIRKESFLKGLEAISSGKYDSALTVEKLQEFLWKDGKPYNYDPKNIPRTQDLTPYYIETCGMYIYINSLIKEKKRRIGDKPYLIEVDKIEACDINTLDDFNIADAIATTLYK